MSRETAMALGLNPISEALRQGLSEKRAKLLAQRDEIEAQYREALDRLEADFGARVAHIDVQLSHVNALLDESPPDHSPEESGAEVPPSSLLSQRLREAG